MDILQIYYKDSINSIHLFKNASTLTKISPTPKHSRCTKDGTLAASTLPLPPLLEALSPRLEPCVAVSTRGIRDLRWLLGRRGACGSPCPGLLRELEARSAEVWWASPVILSPVEMKLELASSMQPAVLGLLRSTADLGARHADWERIFLVDTVNSEL